MDKQQTLLVLLTTLEFLKSQKPNDRSEDDRWMAIMITDMQKVVACFYAYLINPSSLKANTDG